MGEQKHSILNLGTIQSYALIFISEATVTAAGTCGKGAEAHSKFGHWRKKHLTYPTHSGYNISELYSDHLCGLVVRVPGYRSRCPGFNSRCYQIF
jgi:hypothetical protein